MTIQELMRDVGCEKWPERWGTLYDGVLADFEANGCPYLTDAYYDETAEKYGVFAENLALYKEAAAAVAQNRPLSILFALYARALEDREYAYTDTLACKLPKSPKGTHDLALDMLEALLIFTEIPYCYEVLKARGFSEEYIRFTLSKIEFGVADYENRYGAPGYELLYWNQLIIDGKLFRVGRLELELRDNCPAGVSVFENGKGERVMLADGVKLHKSGYALGTIFYEDETDAWEAVIEETEDTFTGHPFDGKGFVLRDTRTLKKSEWRRILSPKDKVISIHIPADGKLDHAAVRATYAEMKKFLATYFPDFAYRAFYCGSWLLDTTLEELLGSNSNIVLFGKDFARTVALDTGYGVFRFAFRVAGKPGTDYPFSDLPEHTRLLKAIKTHYQNGRGIYALGGVFFPSDIA